MQKQYYPRHHGPYKRAAFIFSIAPWNIDWF